MINQAVTSKWGAVPIITTPLNIPLYSGPSPCDLPPHLHTPDSRPFFLPFSFSSSPSISCSSSLLPLLSCFLFCYQDFRTNLKHIHEMNICTLDWPRDFANLSERYLSLMIYDLWSIYINLAIYRKPDLSTQRGINHITCRNRDRNRSPTHL